MLLLLPVQTTAGFRSIPKGFTTCVRCLLLLFCHPDGSWLLRYCNAVRHLLYKIGVRTQVGNIVLSPSCRCDSLRPGCRSLLWLLGQLLVWPLHCHSLLVMASVLVALFWAENDRIEKHMWCISSGAFHSNSLIVTRLCGRGPDAIVGALCAL